MKRAHLAIGLLLLALLALLGFCVLIRTPYSWLILAVTAGTVLIVSGIGIYVRCHLPTVRSKSEVKSIADYYQSERDKR